MKYTVVIPPEVADTIRRLPPPLKRKIRAALDLIAENPYAGKRLQDRLKGLFSFRVSRYRIVYRIVRHRIEVQIIDVGPRTDIYERVTTQIQP